MQGMQRNRLIDNVNNQPSAALQPAFALDGVPPVCAGIITRYRPNPPTAIWPQVRHLTIECALAMNPQTHANARRLMSMISLFCTWVVTTTGCPPTVERVFAQAHLDRYLRTRLGSHSESYRFDVSRALASIAETTLGTRLRQQPTPPAGEAVRPHSAAERAVFVSWAKTLSTPLKRANAHTLLALAGGAGLTSQQIMDATVEDIDFEDSRAFVTVHQPRYRRIPVRRAWLRTLTAGFGTRSTGMAFRGYRLEEYPPNQLHQFLTRTRGELRPSVSRLRAGWIVELLNANLPLDVLLATTGFTTPASLRPYVVYAHRNNLTDWTSSITGEVSA